VHEIFHGCIEHFQNTLRETWKVHEILMHSVKDIRVYKQRSAKYIKSLQLFLVAIPPLHQYAFMAWCFS